LADTNLTASVSMTWLKQSTSGAVTFTILITTTTPQNGIRRVPLLEREGPRVEAPGATGLSSADVQLAAL